MEEQYELPTWQEHEDGSVTIHLPKNWALNLGDDLNRWKAIEEAWRMPEGWQRSPILRENRRESIVYGNCLETIKAMLGRRQVLALMKRAKEDPDAKAWGGAK